MRFQVLQYPSDILCLVKNDVDKLQLRTETLKILMESVSQSDPVVLLCAIGEPSAGKTCIINGIFKHLMSFTSSDRRDFEEYFLQPRNDVRNGPEIDCILACIPPFVVENENTGQRVSIILLDVWNNSVMSEDVYVRLVDFCFQASSVRILPLWGPVRPISWWGGSCVFKTSSLSSAELKQLYFQLDQSSCHWQQPSLPETVQQCSSSFNNGGISNGFPQLAISTCWTNEIQLLTTVEMASLSLNHVNFLLAQIFCLTATAGRKPSDLDMHLVRCIDKINNRTILRHNHSSAQSAITAQEFSVNQQHLIEAYCNKMRQHYADSPDFFLTYQQQSEHSERFVNDLDHMPKAYITAWLPPCFEDLQRFHGNIQASMDELKIEVTKKLETTFSTLEAKFAAELETEEQVTQGFASFQKYENPKNEVEPMAQEVITQVLTSFPSLRSMLLTAGATEIFSSKLKAKIRQELFSQLAFLENQMKMCHEAEARFQSVLSQKIQSSVCLSEEQFDQEVQQVRASIQTENLIRLALTHSLVKIMKKHEDQLRLQNEQIFRVQLEFALKAIETVVASFKARMMAYVETHAVLRNQELLTAFNIMSTNMKTAFTSVPGFSQNNAAWQTVLNSLSSDLEKCCKDIRQSNINTERRWDNAFKSANDKSVSMYNELMNQGLPPYKVPVETLNDLHKACTVKAIDRFTVSSEVTGPTREYWRRIILSKLDDAKEDYEDANELKKPKAEPQQVSTRPISTPGPSSRPSVATHPANSPGLRHITHPTTSSKANPMKYPPTSSKLRPVTPPATSSNWRPVTPPATSSKWRPVTPPATSSKARSMTYPRTASKLGLVTPRATSLKAPPMTSSSLTPCNVGIYFGPEVAVFKPCIPNYSQPAVILSLKPLVTYLNGNIFCGNGADSAPANNGGHSFNIFSILTTKPVAPSTQSSRAVKINGQSVLLTPEAMAVLFFREAIRRLLAQVGIKIGSCTVALPGLLPKEALSVTKEAIILAGIPEVTLEVVTTAIAKNLVQPVPDTYLGTGRRPKKVVTVYHAGPFLEVALLHTSPGQLETQELSGYSDLPAQKQKDLQWLTSQLLDKVYCKDLFTVVMLIEKEGNPQVKEALNKKINGMRCEFKIPVDPVDIATTMAHAGASHRDNGSHSKRPIPKVNYFWYYDAAIGAFRKLFGGKNPTHVHSDWSKLLTPPGRETVKTNVERIVKVLGMQKP